MPFKSRAANVGRIIAFVIPAAVAVALVAGCRSPEIRREPGLNVLLITIDTLRADALGSYGNGNVSTPWLDRVAAGGVRFSRALAHTVVTLPSHANILSGRYPFRHGVRENSGFRFPGDLDTLATVLKAHGYRTGAFVSAFPLDVRFGLGRGFDVYDDRYGKGAERQAFREPERPGTATVAAALSWINQQSAPQSTIRSPQRSSPWFAWVHLYEPHFPYAPPEPFATRYRDQPYLGEVAAVDAALAPLLTPIVELGAAGRTLVVITGDHGESLGDHGELTHGLFAYDATLRVPLIVYQPRLFPPRVVEDPVRHVDILPTVLDAVGIAPLAGLDGASLFSALETGRRAAAPSYFEALSASLNRGWAPLVGVASGSLKYIDLPIPELYDEASDPAESRNLAASRPAQLREMVALLAQLRAGDRGIARIPENAETRQRLRSLGYLAGSAATKSSYTEADDPKRLVGLDHETDELITRYQRGDLRGAIALGEDLVRRRPDMAVSLTHLAFLYNEAGDHASAARIASRALDLNPAAADVASLLAAYLTEAGRAEEAVARLKAYADAPQPDLDVLVAYGVALASSGRSGEALAAFERARAIDPTNGLPLANIGMAHLMAGDRDRASTAFTAALTIDPELARAHNGLGVIAAQRGALEEATMHWKRAIAVDPHDHQVLYNLGDVLIRLGRSAEARSYWERYLREAPEGLDEQDRRRVKAWLGR
jgi:arylsulfatase A-like enzyme/Tfp pilus assembly protein PilF